MHEEIFHNKKLWGWIVVLSGVAFFLQVPLKILPLGIWNWVWPILIIVAGAQWMGKDRG